MTAKEYLKQAYLLDKQIQVEVKELEQLREMRGTIQGCSYGEKIGTNPNRNLEAPFIKTIEKIWDYEQRIDAQIHTKDRAHAAERGYGAKWQRERRKFLESNPFCVKCYEEGHITMATVVDHIVPHRGDQKLFWDRGNWQPLCEHHHNVKTMTEDRYVEYKF